jgi:hypothetical protein
MSAEGVAQDICAGPSDLNYLSRSTPPVRAGLFTAGASRLPALRFGGENPFLRAKGLRVSSTKNTNWEAEFSTRPRETEKRMPTSPQAPFVVLRSHFLFFWQENGLFGYKTGKGIKSPFPHRERRAIRFEAPMRNCCAYQWRDNVDLRIVFQRAYYLGGLLPCLRRHMNCRSHKY